MAFDVPKVILRSTCSQVLRGLVITIPLQKVAIALKIHVFFDNVRANQKGRWLNVLLSLEMVSHPRRVLTVRGTSVGQSQSINV